MDTCMCTFVHVYMYMYVYVYMYTHVLSLLNVCGPLTSCKMPEKSE